MGKTALVLSGGGAKGAFQVGAEKYAREVKGYSWDVIAGVSAGALNGAMLAMEAYEELERLWRNISNDQVYRGKPNLWAAFRILVCGARSVYDNRPLRDLVGRVFDEDRVVKDLRVGAVSLRTGAYEVFTKGNGNLKEAIIASASIPLAFPPVQVTGEWKNMVDGGVRNISPLGDILDTKPDEVVVINCHEREPAVDTGDFSSFIDIGLRTLDIMFNEIFINDLKAFVRINRNVQDAQATDVKLRKKQHEDTEYRYYECKIIEPEKPLGDTLDFSRKSVDESYRIGWETAERVLGN